MKRIAIQGQKGSFHYNVAKKYFGDRIDLVYCETFKSTFEALNDGSVQYIVTAIENTLHGDLSEVFDLLLDYKFPIIGEHTEHIKQQLIGFSDATLETITEVYSHPAALNQCRNWLETYLPNAEIIEYHDTAGAVDYIKKHNLRHAAAIAGAPAAQLYDMQIITTDIEDEKDNFTRFFILGKSPHGDLVNKASLVITTDHSTGALYRALGVFYQLHLNLTKLESRPIRGQAFKYQFFVDVDTTLPQLSLALDELHRIGCDVYVLGEYRSSSMPQA